MDVTITGRNVGVTDRFRTYVEQKSEKIDVLADRALAFEVRISRHHEKSSGSQGEDRVEAHADRTGAARAGRVRGVGQVRRLRPRLRADHGTPPSGA